MARSDTFFLQDPDYSSPVTQNSCKRRKVYCTKQLDNTIAELCRFNTGYGEASHIATAVAKDLGMQDVKVTKKKVQTQLRKNCAEAVRDLNGVVVRGRLP